MGQHPKGSQQRAAAAANINFHSRKAGEAPRALQHTGRAAAPSSGLRADETK